MTTHNEQPMRNLYDDIDYVLISEDRLYERIQELAQQVEDDYADAEELLLVGILKGAVIFISDFSRLLKRPHKIDFMAVSSYGKETKHSGVVQIVMDLRASIHNSHVILIEDIIDSGRTLLYVREMLLARHPASLRILTLLNKPDGREVDVPVDYIGFDIPDEFVVGYGLDYSELYRNSPYIAVLKPQVFKSNQ